MDQLGQRIKQITNELKEYVETRIELLLLNVSDKASLWVGKLVQQLFGYTILGTGLLFLMLALSFYLGELLNNTALGFCLVGGFVFLIGLILVLSQPKNLSRKIQAQIMHDIIDALDSKKEEQLKYIAEKTVEEELNHGN